MPPINAPQPIALSAAASTPARQLADLVLRSAQTLGVKVDWEAGTIAGVAVITAGTTKPSGNGVDPFDVDQVSLQQVAAAINAGAIGLKSRITHPELEGADEITRRMGYISGAYVDGDTVRALMTFHNPQDPDAIRLMDIADKDPGSCGLSIKADTARLEPSDTTPTGLVLRVDRVDAVDWVGDPAGNPGGMLSTYRRPRTTRTGKPITLQQEPAAMYNQAQIDYLIAQGLPFDYETAQLEAFVAALTEEQRGQLAALADQPPAPAETPTETVATTEEEEVAMAEGDDDDEEETPVAASRRRQPQPGRGVQLTQSQIDARIREERVRERQRVQEIRRIALNTRQPAGFADRMIDQEVPIGDVRRIALANVNRAPENMAVSVSVGADLNRETLQEAVQDAILLRASQGRHRFARYDEDGRILLTADRRTAETREPHARARDFRGHALFEIGRRYLISLGYRKADSMARPALAALLMNRTALAAALPGVYMAHGTGDFPYILADAMGKVLRDAYALAPTTWQRWANRTTAPDFKDIKKLQLGAAPDLVELPEGDDIEYGTVTESREVYALSTYAKGLNFTRKAMINDDLSAFDRFPRQMGQAAARKVESLAIAILTANANLADGNALFSTAHANLTTGTLSVASLGALSAAMKTQTALGSDEPLEIGPSFLLVPEALRVTAQQLTGSTVDPALYNNTPNPYGPGQEDHMVTISSARLDANSTTQYYGIASPDQIDTIDVCFLEGQETPLVEEEQEFDTKNLKVSILQDAVAKAIDHRGLVRSSGA